MWKKPMGAALKVFFGFQPLDLGQSADVVPLAQPVQRRSGQVRDRRLQRVEAVVQRQQRALTEGDRQRLIFLAENGRSGLLRPHRRIADVIALLPLSDRLGVHALLPAQLCDRSRRSLYRSSDGVRRRGASVEYLARSASVA